MGTDTATVVLAYCLACATLVVAGTITFAVVVTLVIDWLDDLAESSREGK